MNAQHQSLQPIAELLALAIQRYQLTLENKEKPVDSAPTKSVHVSPINNGENHAK
jgi:hypothetical protein